MSFVSRVRLENGINADLASEGAPQMEVNAVNADDEDIPATDTSTLSHSSTSHRYVVFRLLIEHSKIFFHSPTKLSSSFSNSNNHLIEPIVTPCYLYVKLPNELWFDRIQDLGVEEKKLPKKRYKGSKVISIGPNDEDTLFYYDLTSIAVDYVKLMKGMNTEKTGWQKLPVNLPNVKKKLLRLSYQ